MSPSNSSTPPVVRGCVIPSDQQGTFYGHWPIFPIPVSFYQGQFNNDEMQSIIAAMDTWNSFYQASSGVQKIFDYGTSNNPRTSNATDLASGNSPTVAQGIVQNNQFVGSIVIYKLARWPYTQLPNAMALSSFTPKAALISNTFYWAVIELNYQNFFIKGTKIPDIQTILTHELGHVLGLGHSCEISPTTGFPNCLASDLNPDYINAIMFPTFSFDQNGFGIEKRSLGLNDQGRANCLYPTASSTPTSGN